MSYHSRYYAFQCPECEQQQDEDTGTIKHLQTCLYYGRRSNQRVPTVYGIPKVVAAWLNSPAPKVTA